MQSIEWYVNRFKRMSLAEIGYRTRSLIKGRLEKTGIGMAKNVPIPDVSKRPSNWVRTDLKKAAISNYEEAAQKVASGLLSVFSLTDCHIGAPPNWLQDPRTKKISPLIFGKTLDYRDESLVGDIKYLWEPSRHLHLVALAQAFALTKKQEYLDALQIQLDSWFEQSPYLMGPHWTSSLELGIRLINWSIIWQLVGGYESSFFERENGRSFRERWLTSIYQHCHFIKGHFSRFSSANNHLIGEAAGLFIASVSWPYWPQMAKWQKTAQKILIEECIKQNYEDGVNKEQAIAYQQFVLDFLLLSALAGRANGIEFPDVYCKTLEHMLEYIASIMDVSGNVPMVGDADDGYAVKLSQKEDFCPYKSLLATGAVLFSRPEFKIKAGKFDDKSRWLLGENAENEFNALDESQAILPIRKAFDKGGYYILGCDFERPTEIRILIDSGPLGFLSIAAHGHADALAFTLLAGGREFLVDPGTYAYHTQKKWRDYFRGTTAHNTVCIDNLDQSVSGGNFMWVQHAKACCEYWESNDEKDIFIGFHDGYQRLNDPVLHRRTLTFDKTKRQLEIVDAIQCHSQHIVERYWHFSEKCTVTVSSDGAIHAENSDQFIEIRPTDKVEAKVFHSDEEKPAGWISRRFDKKIPSTTIVWCNEITGYSDLGSLIICH
ncbi:MAG: alginate lyase family protein [Balneolaceae bacterium]|nr:alginate lyase family protein [Balneolaceae bacterium]